MDSIQAEVEQFVNRIKAKLPNSLADLVIATYDNSQASRKATVMVPYWFPIVEHGRGPRKSGVSSDLWVKIYRWMEARNMFKSTTSKGKINEAQSLTWYINKYGTKQFRERIYKDIYTSETRALQVAVRANALATVKKITSDLVLLG